MLNETTGQRVPFWKLLFFLIPMVAGSGCAFMAAYYSFRQDGENSVTFGIIAFALFVLGKLISWGLRSG